MSDQLSDRNQCIFIHVPKTGGTGIERSAIFDDARGPRGAVPGGHSTALDFKKKYPQKFDSYYKFTMVRNPYDRLISSYFWLARGGSGSPGDRKLFESLFRNGPTNFDSFCQDLLSRDLLGTIPHLKPQHFFICDPDMNVMVDFIGRQESYEEDTRVIFRQLGLPYEYRHSASTSHRHFSTYYSESIGEKVHRLYKKDFELLGYDREIPHGNTTLHHFNRAWSRLSHAGSSLKHFFFSTGHNRDKRQP